MALHLDEPVGIDPRVDVVFLSLFGNPAHERVLVSFLNAVLSPGVPITRAAVRNPFHPSRFEDHKSLGLDIQAVDGEGRTFQVETQRRADAGLDRRMLYGWARLYSDQMEKGSPYEELRPVVSVWVCEQDVFPAATKPHLRFGLYEVDERFPLHTDIRFDVLQLSRWEASREELAGSALGEWFWFFNEAEPWREVPVPIDTPALEEAMAILNDFRTDVNLNEIYRGRIEAERIEKGRQRELDRALQALDEAIAREERALAEKDAALAELAALRARLGDGSV